MTGGNGNAREGERDRRPSAPSFRIRLVLGPSLLEGGELYAGRIDGDDLGIGVERHLQASRIGDLRHQTYIRERDLGAMSVRPSPEHRLERVEALSNPMAV